MRLGGANLQKMRLEQHSESSRLLSEITFLASSYLLKLPRLLCATGIKSSPRDLPKNSSISVAILTASLHYITGESRTDARSMHWSKVFIVTVLQHFYINQKQTIDFVLFFFNPLDKFFGFFFPFLFAATV